MTNKNINFFKDIKPAVKKKGKQKPLSDVGAITTGAITALIGTALILETAKLIGSS